MIRLTVKELILMLMELITQENGLTTNKKVKVKKHGLMVHNTKVNIKMVRRMDVAS